ncbi:MAG: polysaccharide biosynthesis protein, partial [Nitrospira defluvii]|nr:polysaccharide biosynthesis protein [Nitrospira defluvii]
DKDIALTYLGCRPGEKLVEELVAGHETLEATSAPKVLCVRQDSARLLSHLPGLITRLEESAAEGNVSNVLAVLCDILPTYRPWGVSPIHEGVGDSDGMVPADVLSSPADAVTIARLSQADSRRRG